MDELTHGCTSDNAKKPENDEYDGDGVEHLEIRILKFATACSLVGDAMWSESHD